MSEFKTKTKMKPAAKFTIMAFVVVALFFGVKYFMPKKTSAAKELQALVIDSH